jgi:prepilin-type processing-associated H-X9-DG protein
VPEAYGSYGVNWCVGAPPRDQGARKVVWWRTTNDPQAAGAPFMFDSCWCVAGLGVEESPPPDRDAVPVRTMETEDRFVDWTCFNRHDGGLNYLFLDWSVRKVGLKELWTLKWHRQFNTCGPWTKAGGVTPEQWPAWMRKFKDY